MTLPSGLSTSGSIHAPIAVICDAPSQEVYRSGWVMPTAAMQMFGGYATRNGFYTSDFVFITCCPPIPEEALTSVSKTKKFAEPYQANLRELVGQLTNVKAIITLGSLAINQLSKKPMAISKVHGQPLVIEGVSVPVVPIMSPGHVLRKPDLASQFATDFELFAQLRDSNWRTSTYSDSVIAANYQWSLDISSIVRTSPKGLALDTETVGFFRPGFSSVGRLLTVQLSVKEGESFVIPMDRDYWEHWTGDAMMESELARNIRVHAINTAINVPRNRHLSLDAEPETYADKFRREWRSRYPIMPQGYEAKIKEQIRQLVGNSRTAIVGHNLKYDYHVMKANGMPIANWWADTMQLAFAMDENMTEKSLDEVTRRWCKPLAGYADAFNKKWNKERMDLIPPWELLPYAGGDTDAALRLANYLVTQVRKDMRQWKSFFSVQMPALRAFAAMESQGVLIDQNALEELANSAKEAEVSIFGDLIQRVPMAVRAKHLESHGPDGLRFSRSDFVIDTLFTREGFNLKPIKFTKSTAKSDIKKPSTSSKDHLPFFLNFKTPPDSAYPEGYPFVASLVEYQKLNKLRTTYIGDQEERSGFWQYIAGDSKIHPSFFLNDTVTGRSSSRNPNSQNLPKRAKAGSRMATLVSGFRRIFKAAPGYKLLEVDLSQAELRIAAWMSMDPVMLAVYANDGDIHTTTAASVLGVTMEQFAQLEASQQKMYRTYAKAVNFGFLFGMSHIKFKDYAKTDYELEFTEEQALELRQKFFRTYPALEGWHEAMKTFVRKNGYVRSLHGAVRHLSNIHSSDRTVQRETERQSINSPVQRLASDLGLMAMARLARDTDWNILRPLMFIHDALVVEVREDYYELAMGWVKFYMETPPLQKWFGITSPIPIKADVSGGDSLGDMAEFHDVIAEAPPFYDAALDAKGWA